MSGFRVRSDQEMLCLPLGSTGAPPARDTMGVNVIGVVVRDEEDV